MPKTSNIRPIRTISTALRLFICCVLFAVVTRAQIDRSRPGTTPNVRVKDNVADAVSRVRQGEFFPADLDLIATAQGKQAIPDLEKQFDLTKDSSSKASIASALVRLGDQNSVYWDYLVQGAADAITSDMPSPRRYDAKGKMLHGLSPESVTWGKAHNLTEADLEERIYELFSKVAFLAKTRDRRAIPLLRDALFSSNYLIQSAAADGLAQLQDKASIPLIIEACRQAPADAAIAIARPLLDFNDPQAQAAAKEFRPAKAAK